MLRTFGILLLLAPALLAREPFPADYTPSPCVTDAATDRVGTTFPQSQISDLAALKGYDVGQEWVDAHWAELTTALRPLWAKTATCYATPGNDNLFCNDVIQPAAFAVCNRYPEGSVDREKCIFTMSAILFGQDDQSKPVWTELQNCGAAKRTNEERPLDVWIEPARFDDSYPGHFTVFAVDRETRVPVRARLWFDTAEIVYADDVPNGTPTTFYKAPWKPKLARVPNAQGHRDVVPPTLRVEASGYRTEKLQLPMEVSVMKVKMTPPASKLKRGRNTVTITAVDAATGEPVEARVMGGELVLGKTNVPFQLELKRGAKRPEIWVTSLYDRYNDVVVAPAK